jgi:RNA polymerase sigma factor (sigma-70 family)
MSETALLDQIKSYLTAQANGAAATPEERSAWHDFYHAHDPLIRANVKHARTSAVDVDDLAQEVWLRLSRDLLRLKLDPDRGTLDARIGTIARRCAGKFARRSRRRPEPMMGDEFAAMLLDPREGPLSGFEKEEYRRQLWNARESVRSGLNDVSRQMLDMRLEQERSVPEIASALNISEGAAKMRLFRALRELRDLLRKQGLAPS